MIYEILIEQTFLFYQCTILSNDKTDLFVLFFDLDMDTAPHKLCVLFQSVTAFF